jgi:hypothetical protein
MVSHVYNSLKKDLRISTLERLAKAYGIKVWQLLAPPTPKTKIKKHCGGGNMMPVE